MKRLVNFALAALLAAALMFGGRLLGWNGERLERTQSVKRAQRAAHLEMTEPTPSPTEEESPTDPEIPPVDLEALREVNPDVLGWIIIPGTPISYPLLRGEDNQYYLNHNWEKVPDPGGSIFLECRCDPELADFNTIIYGHRMADSSMFNSLGHYEDADYMAAHPRVCLLGDWGVRSYRVFAALEVGVTDPVYWLLGQGAAHREEVIGFCADHARTSLGELPAGEDRILTLSTCTGLTRSDRRWVVMAAEERS